MEWTRLGYIVYGIIMMGLMVGLIVEIVSLTSLATFEMTRLLVGELY